MHMMVVQQRVVVGAAFADDALQLHGAQIWTTMLLELQPRQLRDQNRSREFKGVLVAQRRRLGVRVASAALSDVSGVDVLGMPSGNRLEGA